MLQEKRTGGERGLLPGRTGRTEAKGTGIKLINKNAGFLTGNFGRRKLFFAMLIRVVANMRFTNGTLYRARSSGAMLAADVDSAEAEDNVSTGGGASKAHHGTEARKEKQLIELMAKLGAGWPGNDLVIEHGTLCVDGNVNEKTVG